MPNGMDQIATLASKPNGITNSNIMEALKLKGDI